MEFEGRKRNEAKFDRKESYKNYLKNNNVNEKFLNRIVSTDLEGLKKEEVEKKEEKFIDDLPLPPKYTGDIKIYKNKPDKSVSSINLETFFYW